MKRKLTLLAPALLSFAMPLVRAADIPRPAPEFAISMNDGRTIHLSDYKGKVVVLCFILTNCPHCQKTTGFLIKDQAEYGGRGLQVIESAIQQGAALAVPDFVRQFGVNFPVGYNNPQPAIDFMQHPPMLIPHMPLLAFIDRKGMIRAQHEGDDEKFFGDEQEQNLRTQIEALLKEGGPAKTAGKTKTK